MISAELSLSDHLIDTTSFMIMLATLMNILPPLAATVSIVFMSIRIYETATVQNMILRYRVKKYYKRNNPEAPK